MNAKMLTGRKVVFGALIFLFALLPQFVAAQQSCEDREVALQQAVTVQDYDNFIRIFDGIDKLQVLEENQNGAHVEFWIDAVLKKLHYVLYRKYSVEGERIDWHRESGDLKSIQGTWRIEETTLPTKKLIVYESYVDIGYSVITWAIRLGAKSKARKMAYRLRKWLEQSKQ